MAISHKERVFNNHLSGHMRQIRAALDDWSLKEWREYLVVRKAGDPESYVVLANPSDESDFQEKLVLLHTTTAQKGE